MNDREPNLAGTFLREMNKDTNEQRPRVGVGVAIWRYKYDTFEVLLGKRKGSHGAGEYSFPGGKMDGKERPEHAAIRETREEIGCYIECIKPVTYWSHETYPELPYSFVTLYFSAQLMEGEIVQNMEPEKCEGWDWYSWRDLPSPLFAGIEKMSRQISYF